LLNVGLAAVEQADLVVLVGTNPRHEAPLLQARLRKGFLHRGLEVAVVGPAVKLTCEYDHVGTSPQALLDALAPGQRASSPLAKKLAQAKRPLVLVGADVAARDDAPAIFAALADLPSWTNVHKDTWNGVAVLQRVRGWCGSRKDHESGHKLTYTGAR
jgi:NADH dehydrogenase (ubiquinone) Fe-S protein 1